MKLVRRGRTKVSPEGFMTRERDDGTRSPGVGVPMWGSVNAVLGYACSAAIASVFYIIWLCESLSYAAAQGPTMSLQFRLGFSVFLCVFGGFLLALGLMIAPWLLAVRGYRRVKLPGWIYYSAIGAVSTVVIGCATSSLAPKPLFVEDQTFIEGAMIAAERQGVCMLLAGLLFGLTYWFLSGRRRSAATAAGARP
jgi:hypothetical protein